MQACVAARLACSAASAAALLADGAAVAARARRALLIERLPSSAADKLADALAVLLPPGAGADLLVLVLAGNLFFLHASALAPPADVGCILISESEGTPTLLPVGGRRHAAWEGRMDDALAVIRTAVSAAARGEGGRPRVVRAAVPRAVCPVALAGIVLGYPLVYCTHSEGEEATEDEADEWAPPLRHCLAGSALTVHSAILAPSGREEGGCSQVDFSHPTDAEAAAAPLVDAWRARIRADAEAAAYTVCFSTRTAEPGALAL
jgi:hypothetical protein